MLEKILEDIGTVCVIFVIILVMLAFADRKVGQCKQILIIHTVI